MNIALVAIGRRENEYAREFVAYYLEAGFDHIIIIDNNHRKEEHFEDVLSDYMADGKVTIENYRDRELVQCIAYNDIYAKYGSRYDWLAYFDFDEFLTVNDGRTVKEWLAGFPKDADEVLINWKIMTDNGLMENDGRPMIERFTEPMPLDTVLKKNIPENNHVKCIVRGGMDHSEFTRTPHSSDNCTHCYHASGHPCPSSPFHPYDHSTAMLLHFTTKTIGEWMRNKWQKGVGTAVGDSFKRKYREYFFRINKRTPEKEAYMAAFEQSYARRLTVCIVHYNTPELTMAAIRSLWKHTPGVYVIVFDNSDRRPFTAAAARPLDACAASNSSKATGRRDSGNLFTLHSSLLEVIDNTRGQLIDFDQWLNTFPDREPSPGNNYGSAKHCYSVQWLIDHRRNPFMLMDSDVLVRQDIAPLFDDRFAFVAHVGCNTRRRFGFELLKADPFLCYVNVPMLRQYGVRYFDSAHMWNLVSRSPNNRYDTGAWLYHEVKAKRLPFRDVDVKADYIHHLGHGSWRNKDYRQWLEEYQDLWK